MMLLPYGKKTLDKNKNNIMINENMNTGEKLKEQFETNANFAAACRFCAAAGILFGICDASKMVVPEEIEEAFRVKRDYCYAFLGGRRPKSVELLTAHFEYVGECLVRTKTLEKAVSEVIALAPQAQWNKLQLPKSA